MYIETAAIAAIAGVFVKILDIIYAYIKNKVTVDKPEDRIKDILDKVEKIEEILHLTDTDGQRLIHFPRRLIHQMDSNSELLIKMSYNNDMVTKTLDRITTTLESTVRVLDRLENKISEKK